VLHTLSSIGAPITSQSSPPCCGGGVVQFRCRICSPIPQDLEHSVKLDQDEYPPLIGQGWVLHSTVSFVAPEQFMPPCLGDGLEQLLVLTLEPLPHDLEQLVKLDHELNPP